MAKYKVPKALKQAISQAIADWRLGEISESAEIIGQAVCRCLSENPMVPNEKQAGEMMYGMSGLDSMGRSALIKGAVEWQRRMFLSPDPPSKRELVQKVVDDMTDDDTFAITAHRKEFVDKLMAVFEEGQ